jgi:hypothetical protein
MDPPLLRHLQLPPPDRGGGTIALLALADLQPWHQPAVLALQQQLDQQGTGLETTACRQRMSCDRPP